MFPKCFTLVLLRERLLPEQSYTIQGAARTPPEPLTARIRDPLQQVAPVSQWVPLQTPHTQKHTHIL